MFAKVDASSSQTDCNRIVSYVPSVPHYINNNTTALLAAEIIPVFK